MAFISTERTGSFLVSSLMRFHEIVIFSVSLLIAAAISNSDWSHTETADKFMFGAGWRDVASAAELVLPGMCRTRKCHGRVRCFKRKSHVLCISSKVWSLNIFCQRRVVCLNKKVMAALCEIFHLFEAPCYGQCLSLPRRRHIVPRHSSKNVTQPKSPFKHRGSSPGDLKHNRSAFAAGSNQYLATTSLG